MKRTLTACFALVVFALSGSVAPARAADGDGDGSFGGDGSDATISVWAGAGTDGTTSDADDPSGPRRWVRRSTPDPRQPSDPIAGICNPGNDPITGAIRFGWPFTVETIDTTTGAVVGASRVCVALTGAAPGVPPAPTVGQPPTFGEVWRAASVPAPRIGVNPTGEGVTGLATRLWATSPDTVDISVTIRGYTATGTARRTEFWFRPGDGDELIRRGNGGNSNAPALEHIYERRGDYLLGAGALWEATVTVSGPDLPASTIDLGSALLVVDRDYHVVEVRARLTD